MIPTIQWSQLFDDPLANYDPQFFDDPQLFDDQLEVWTLIIQKSTVIPPSLMVLFSKWYYNCLGRPSLFQCLQKRPVLYLRGKKIWPRCKDSISESHLWKRACAKAIWLPLSLLADLAQVAAHQEGDLKIQDGQRGGREGLQRAGSLRHRGHRHPCPRRVWHCR